MDKHHLHDRNESDDTAIFRAKTATEQPRENPAGDVDDIMGSREDVLTLICEMCGKDYFFTDSEPPPQMTCEKCGGGVFRAFDDSVGDEVVDDFRDSTELDLRPDDAEGDVLPGDVMDLNNL
jgi:hypothetical protein